jgi:hypothetical protein
MRVADSLHRIAHLNEVSAKLRPADRTSHPERVGREAALTEFGYLDLNIGLLQV